jgi:hypothetical protein
MRAGRARFPKCLCLLIQRMDKQGAEVDTHLFCNYDNL